jgi:phosphonate transport system substrate-binding protein
MTKRNLTLALLGLLVIVALALAACQPAPAPTEAPPPEEEEAPPPEEEEAPPPEEEAGPALGSEERPIQVLFVPSVEAEAIVSGGEIMATALKEATGLNFEVSVPTSYAATVEAMCASPGDTMGFIPALGYVLANNRCGVEVGAAAVRYGLSWYTTMYLVARDSEFETFDDLDGAVWAFPDPGSTSGYLYPSSEFKAAGIEPGEQLETGGHPQAVLAVYNGEADVGTAYFSPPQKPDDPTYQWQYGDNPEPWEVDPSECFVSEEGTLLCGEYEVLDARAAVVDTAPDIIAKTRILALSAQIPNDTLSFGPDFPPELRTQIIDALVAFSQTEEWNQSIGSKDFYNWTGLEPVEDSAYDPVRNLIEQLGYTEEDIFGK